ncbi:hypothetical protein, partial [Staphylococcus auricularis]|uniref:hypothetical protein n=1 Tax=Staphylococcus auricularis TaxID=29379 RepID=UPI001CD9C449
MNEGLVKYKNEGKQVDEEVEELNEELVEGREGVEKYRGEVNVLEEGKKNECKRNGGFEEDEGNLGEEVDRLECEKGEREERIDKLKGEEERLREEIHEV